jgi:hypothetical protein
MLNLTIDTNLTQLQSNSWLNPECDGFVKYGLFSKHRTKNRCIGIV